MVITHKHNDGALPGTIIHSYIFFQELMSTTTDLSPFMVVFERVFFHVHRHANSLHFPEIAMSYPTDHDIYPQRPTAVWQFKEISPQRA